MGRKPKNRKAITRSDSGTCNVCSAPCSSCLHVNRGLTTVKAEESSGETCQENVGSQYSVTDMHIKICDSESKFGVEHLCDKIEDKSRYEEQKGVEGLKDSASCVTGGREANILASSNNKSVEIRHDIGELSSPNKKLIESPCPEEKGVVELSNLSNKLSNKEAEYDLDPAEETVDHCVNGEGHSMALEEACLKVEEGTLENTVTENQPNKVDDSLVQNNETEKVESCELAGLRESNKNSQPMIDSDEPDALENDVNVCDICGDAGREDLLAACSRCGDGAEHTYCMREMIAKVPEGDWLCEECKHEIKSTDAVLTMEYQYYEGASVENTGFASNVDKKEVDGDAIKPRKRILGKRDIYDRPTEDIEASPLSKKQALDLTVVSPKGKVKSNFRDPSFKNLNKGELKPHQSSDCEALEDPSSLRGLGNHEARGTLSKSSSFSTNPKEKAAHIDKKEGTSKFIGRSTSFKPSGLSRLSHSEPKVKMLSPKSPYPQDGKGVKQAKPPNTLDKKSSFKPERPLVSSRLSSSAVSASNSDQKLTPTDPVVSNDIEIKGGPSDNKPSTLSRSTSYLARKGETKISSIPDQRTKEAGLGDDLASGNYTTENLISNSRGGLPGDRTKDSSVSRYRTNIVNDVSTTRSSADVIKGNKLKAAIEAALLKKPGICRKNKPADQSDDVSTPRPNLNSEIRIDLSNSSKKSNMAFAYEAHEGKNQPFATVSILSKMPVLPEHEYIWQGGFDICKIGKLVDLCDGVQAHLSTCASPKVLEVVNKFPSKVVLREVPRSSTWPVQFQEAGVKEDNIALYFFAKDLDSYERNYKFLLETMMRRDLALKGNLDGIELLIFPSNHLPHNAQRWNMLYFLWGVFRGKKANCVQNVSDSKVCNNANADSNNCVSLELEHHTSDNVKGVRDTQVSLSDSKCEYLQRNAEKQDLVVDAKRIGGLSVQETKSTTMDEKVDLKTNTKPDLANVQPFVQYNKTDPPNAQRTVKQEEESADASSVQERKMLIDQATDEPNESLFSHKKQKTGPVVIESAGDNMFPKIVPNFGPGLEGENKGPKRGFVLDLNETQDYSPDGPSPAAKQEEKACLFDLNVAQDYPLD